MVSVIVVDDNNAAREHLGKALSSFPGLKVKMVQDLAEAKSLIERYDLALISAGLSQDGAYNFLRYLQREHTRVRGVVVDPGRQSVNAVRFYEAGACAIVCASSSPLEMYELIMRVQDGEAIIPPAAASGLLKRLSELSVWLEDFHLQARQMGVLTRREQEVLTLIGRDFSNQDIANALFIEVGTVKNHVHRILAKLNVSSRREAANLAVIHHERLHRQRAISF